MSVCLPVCLSVRHVATFILFDFILQHEEKLHSLQEDKVDNGALHFSENACKRGFFNNG